MLRACVGDATRFSPFQGELHAPSPGQTRPKLEYFLHADHVILGEVLAEELQPLCLRKKPSTCIFAPPSACRAAHRTFQMPAGNGGVKKLYVRTRSENGSEMRR